MARKTNRKQTKSFKFKPFSTKQKKLLYWWEDYSPYKDYDIVIADGAIRSGKTISMICSFLRWSQANHQDENFIIAGKSIGALKRNVINPMQEILQAWGWDYYYHRSEHYIVIGTNTYYLFGANNERSQDTLQGITAAGGLGDEVALFPKSFVDQMIGRCSVDGSKIFFNCNPAGPYHYIKTEYIDKRKEKKIYYLHFEMDDNLSLAQKIKNRFKRMFSGVFYKRYILGLWVAAEGLIYDMFNDKKHVVKKLPKEFDDLFVTVDYGTSTVTTFLLIGKVGDTYYVIDEYYYDVTSNNPEESDGSDLYTQKTDAEFADDLQDFISDRKVKYIFYDTNAQSFAAELRKRGYTKIARPAHKGPGSVLNGIREVAGCINAGQLFVYYKCTNLLREFFSYLWDPKAQERGEDEPIKKYDHALDALRYCIYTLLRYSEGRKVRRSSINASKVFKS